MAENMHDHSHEVKPALTPEEWAGFRAFWGSSDVGAFHIWPEAEGASLDISDGDVSVELEPEEYHLIPQRGLHAVAALCLHNQPFGFTQKDVEMLRTLFGPAHDDWAFPNLGGWGRDLVDRIEALLPPAPLEAKGQEVEKRSVRFVGGPKDGDEMMLPVGEEGRVKVLLQEPVPPKWFDDEWGWKTTVQGYYDIEGDVARYVDPAEGRTA